MSEIKFKEMTVSGKDPEEYSDVLVYDRKFTGIEEISIRTSGPTDKVEFRTSRHIEVVDFIEDDEGARYPVSRAVAWTEADSELLAAVFKWYNQMREVA